MSFIRFQSRMAHYARWVLWLLLGIFVITAFYWFDPGRRGTRRARGEEAVVRVNGTRIGYGEFGEALRAVAKQQGMESLALANWVTNAVVQQLVERTLLRQAVKKNRISVQRAEIDARIKQMVDAQLKADFPDRVELKRYLLSRGLTLEKLQEDIRGRINLGEIEESLALDKLRAKAISGLKVSDEELKDGFPTLEVRSVTIPIVEGKEAEAKAKAAEVVAKARGGQDFAALAQEYGDPATPKEQRGRVQKWPLLYLREFLPAAAAEAVRRLEPNQVTDAVKADRAFYVTQLLKKEVSLPADFDKQKEALRAHMLMYKQRQAWDDYVDGLRKSAKIEYLSPEVEGAVAAAQGQTDKAIELLKKAEAKGPMDAEAVYFSLGMFCEQKADWEQAARYYRKAAEEAAAPEAYIALARVLDKQGKRQEALQALAEAKEEAGEDVEMRRSVRDAYQALGERALAAQEDQWLKQAEAEATAARATAPSEGEQ